MSPTPSDEIRPPVGLLYEHLPFVGDPRVTSTPNWTLPATGGYEAGIKVGREMALAFLLFLQRGHHPGGYIFHLCRIALSFFRRFDDEGGLSALDDAQRSIRIESLRGQFFGFFNEISAWLHTACIESSYLNNFSLEELSKQAAETLSHGLQSEEDTPEELWLTELDMAGSCPPLEQIQELLIQAPATAHHARPVVRMFWFFFGMYQGRLLHEKLDAPEPQAIEIILEGL